MGSSSSREPDLGCPEPGSWLSRFYGSAQIGGLWAKRVTDPPAPPLDRPYLSRSALGGAAQMVGLPGSGGRSLRGRRQVPPLRLALPWPDHWPQSPGAWPNWGWGRLRWPPARLSACLPGLRARRPGWLGCAWVPAPALAPAMGNSHHKRKAPSCPRARSFWRFGRSTKRPAGRGWGWGRGRRGGGSPCCSCSRHCCCPLPGLGRCVWRAGNPPYRPHSLHSHRDTRTYQCPREAYVYVHNLHSHTTPTRMYRYADTKSHTHSHLHLCCRMHRS